MHAPGAVGSLMEMGDEMKYELLLELYNGIYIWIYDEEYDLGVVHLGLRFFFLALVYG